MSTKRMRTGLRAAVAAGALTGLAGGAAPLGRAAGEPSPRDQPGASAPATERIYRGPGLTAFKAGHRAWELHDWETTLARMAEAMNADRDQPEALVRIPGVFFSPYIPRYYRSYAQCQLGQCAEAQREMDEVLRLLKDSASYLRDRYTRDCEKACPVSGSN
jgi:hypothetical protein